MKKIKNVTSYSGITRLYFEAIIKSIIKIASLDTRGCIVLDFGCGHGMLKRTVKGSKVVNFDIVPELSDISDWRQQQFDVVVANEVFYSFSQKQLEALLKELFIKNSELEIVVGISRQGILNNIGKLLLGHSDAHDGTLLKPDEELMVIRKYVDIVKKNSVFFLADVYLCKFKKNIIP